VQQRRRTGRVAGNCCHFELEADLLCLPDYSTRVMDSVLPPERSVSSCRGSSRMWAVQDGTGSSMVRHARSADGSDSPGAACMTSLTAPAGRGRVTWYRLLGYF